MMSVFLLALAFLAVCFALRRLFLVQRFIAEHGKEIDRQNDEIVQTWEIERPGEQTISIERRIKPSALLAPTIVVKKTYTKTIDE